MTGASCLVLLFQKVEQAAWSQRPKHSECFSSWEEQAQLKERKDFPTPNRLTHIKTYLKIYSYILPT